MNDVRDDSATSKTGDRIDNQLNDFCARIDELLVRERLFREDFERRLSAEVLTRERLLREDFERLISQELRGYIDGRFAHYHLRRPVTYDERAKVLIHTIDGHRLILDMREPFMAHHLIEHGEWERPLRNLIRRLLPERGTFVDVGANIGVHSLLAANLVGTDGRVIALEPHPITRAILRENVEINGLGDVIAVLDSAASSIPNQNVSFQYLPQHPAMSGFQVPSNRIDALRGAPETIEVRTTTLDNLLAPFNYSADLVKIDVEGFELLVLQGAPNVLATNPDVCIVIEFEPTLVTSVLGQDAVADLWRLVENAGLIALLVENEISPTALSWDEFAKKGGDLVLVRPHSHPHDIIANLA